MVIEVAKKTSFMIVLYLREAGGRGERVRCTDSVAPRLLAGTLSCAAGVQLRSLCSTAVPKGQAAAAALPPCRRRRTMR